MLKSFKTEINPTLEQKTKINKTIGICRYVYNFYLAHNKELHDSGQKFISGKSFSVWLNNEYLLNNPDYAWICEEEYEQLAEWLKELKKFREQEPCEDAISRKAILEWIKGSLEQYANTYSNDMLNMWMLFEEQIKAMSPIQPKAKVGKWIIWHEKITRDSGVIEHKPHCKCSECNREYDSYSTRFMNYCPNCGVKMEVEE